MTELYLMDCLAMTEEMYGAYYRLADGARRAAADALPSAEQARLSLGAWIALRCALYFNGLEYGKWRTAKGGKPFLEGVAAKFSLSHSGRYALCALSDREVGCDIQRVRPVDDRVADRVLCGREKEVYAGLASDREDFFFRVWTMKESYLKYTGKGLCGGMSALCVPLGRGESLCEAGVPVAVKLTRLPAPEGYEIACCSLSECSGMRDVTQFVCGGDALGALRGGSPV